MQRSRRAPPPGRPSVRAYLACYGLYAVLLVLCYYLFFVWRATAFAFFTAFFARSLTAPPLYDLVVVLLGLGLFVVAMGAEPYLRGGVRKGRLLTRFATVAGPVAGVIALGLALHELIDLVG